MTDLRTTRLRSNPRFRLIPFDQIEEFERPPLQAMAAAADFYGLLAPPPTSSLPAKSVSRDAALLFLTLREPACVPHLLSTLFGSEAEDRVRELVLDGVFELEQGGRFVSGASAFPAGNTPHLDIAASRVAQLSADAITYAAALSGMPVADLAMRLYMYNRAPVTGRHMNLFPDDEAVLQYLAGDSPAADLLASRWKREVVHQAWLMWKQPSIGSGHSFKLYVSPTLEHLPQTFRIAVDAFARVKCATFKVGRTAFGLLRPDKLVAYFSSLEQLREAAELIRASASGIAAQGVPFTAAIANDGLVSWGMDPPLLEQVLVEQQHQSWRQWVAGRVAVFILAAKESGAKDIVSFVLERLALEGVDPATWTPNLAIWRGFTGVAEEVMA